MDTELEKKTEKTRKRTKGFLIASLCMICFCILFLILIIGLLNSVSNFRNSVDIASDSKDVASLLIGSFAYAGVLYLEWIIYIYCFAYPIVFLVPATTLSIIGLVKLSKKKYKCANILVTIGFIVSILSTICALFPLVFLLF